MPSPKAANNCKCEVCNKEFHLKPSSIKRGRGRFCSRVCKSKSQENQITTTCLTCGNVFTVKKSVYTKGHAKNCSLACKNKFLSGPNAAHWIDGRSYKEHNGVAKGENHWNWQGGKTAKIDTIRASVAYKQWRTKVFERDNYTCQICGKKGVYLQAHHIKDLSSHLELAFEVSNGQTLCVPCHHQTDNFGFKGMWRKRWNQLQNQ